MDQAIASTDRTRDQRSFVVPAPHEWDGIGQALRAAYRDYRDPPCDMADMLTCLERVD